MSDKKLIECRAERKDLKYRVMELRELLDMPERTALKQLHFKNKLLRDTAAALRSKASSLEQSGKDLLAQIEPLREALGAEKHRTIELVQKQAEVVAWFNQHGHPLAPNEPIVQKLDNLEASIQSERQVVEDAIKYFAKYPELAKTDNCEKAVAFLREGKDAAKQLRDKELVAQAAVIGQYKQDLEAMSNALGLLKEATETLDKVKYLDQLAPVPMAEFLIGIETFLAKHEIKAILEKGK